MKASDEREKKMTRRELVKMLESEFAPDEKVFFLYIDDGWETRGEALDVKTHEEETCEWHYETLENGEWVRYPKRVCHPSNDLEYCRAHGHECYPLGYTGKRDDSWWRQVIDERRTDTRKCVTIA